jgi:hypothetical protein
MPGLAIMLLEPDCGHDAGSARATGDMGNTPQPANGPLQPPGLSAGG